MNTGLGMRKKRWIVSACARWIQEGFKGGFSVEGPQSTPLGVLFLGDLARILGVCPAVTLNDHAGHFALDVLVTGNPDLLHPVVDHLRREGVNNSRATNANLVNCSLKVFRKFPIV